MKYSRFIQDTLSSKNGIRWNYYQSVIRQIKRCLLRQIKTGFTEHLTMV